LERSVEKNGRDVIWPGRSVSNYPELEKTIDDGLSGGGGEATNEFDEMYAILIVPVNCTLKRGGIRNNFLISERRFIFQRAV